VTTKTFFDTYFEYTEKTEPPLLFHRWSVIATLGAVLGRKVWIPFGQFRIFPNIYCMLIGDPGTRKSTAIKLAKKLANSSGYSTFAAERTTKEKFLLDLEGVDDGDESNKIVGSAVMENLFGSSLGGGDPKEVFIAADEFNDFLGSGGIDFLSLLGSLWDWDDEDNPYKQRLKNSRSVSIYQPTISLLAGNTHAGFAQAIPTEALGQGFMSRLLLVFAEPSGIQITFPEPPPDNLKRELVGLIHTMQKDLSGPMTITKGAKDMCDVIYRAKSKITDARFTHYGTRRFTHLLKLCIIVAASRLSMEIGKEDVLLANTIMSYTEHFMPKALGEFGKAKNADVANQIIQYLSSKTLPTDTVLIWKDVAQKNLDRQEDLHKMLLGMQTAGQVIWIKNTAAQGWLIKREMLSNNTVYVDYDLLKEHKRIKLD
jgi:hypothetical protein